MDAGDDRAAEIAGGLESFFERGKAVERPNSSTRNQSLRSGVRSNVISVFMAVSSHRVSSCEQIDMST